MARDRPSPYGKGRRFFHRSAGASDATRASERVSLAIRLAVRPHPPPVDQDRLILICSGSGDPELQRWAQCLPVFVRASKAG